MRLCAKWTRNSLKYIAKINLVRVREASVHIKWFIFSIHIYIIPSPRSVLFRMSAELPFRPVLHTAILARGKLPHILNKILIYI